MLKDRRRGIFRVTLQALEQPEMRQLMSACTIIGAELLEPIDTVQYLATSPLFDEIDGDEPSPFYRLIVEKQEPLGQLTLRADRQPQVGVDRAPGPDMTVLGMFDQKGLLIDCGPLLHCETVYEAAKRMRADMDRAQDAMQLETDDEKPHEFAALSINPNRCLCGRHKDSPLHQQSERTS